MAAAACPQWSVVSAPITAPAMNPPTTALNLTACGPADRSRSTNRRCKATTMLRMLPLVANEVYGVSTNVRNIKLDCGDQ